MNIHLLNKVLHFEVRLVQMTLAFELLNNRWFGAITYLYISGTGVASSTLFLDTILNPFYFHTSILIEWKEKHTYYLWARIRILLEEFDHFKV